ncbi:MAG: hypothetical protein JXR95_12420, partial [Deltaproteobacteria bacterium]|nr:hypothetical protein [Deltaproteobacteria bacterium]
VSLYVRVFPLSYDSTIRILKSKLSIFISLSDQFFPFLLIPFFIFFDPFIVVEEVFSIVIPSLATRF